MEKSSEGKAADKAEIANQNESSSAIESSAIDNKQQPVAKNTVSRGWRWLAMLLMLSILALVVVIGWYGFQVYQRVEGADEVSAQQADKVLILADQLATESSARRTLEAQLSARIADFELVTETQAREIAELTSLDRNQWYMAELEYLVRLANQRLLTERRPQGALALLEAADKLLGSMDNINVLPVRGALARDISSLRLVELVDHEGIYSRLGALTPSLLVLSALPAQNFGELLNNSTRRDFNDDQASEQAVDNSAEAEPEGSWYHRVWSNAQAALSQFSRDHFHVRYREVPVQALVSVKQERWLRHDMAINISTAQQALLRGEQEIYSASLALVGNHLRDYFSGSKSATSLIAEVGMLRELNIHQVLPDITSSIDALKQLQAKPSKTSNDGGR